MIFQRLKELNNILRNNLTLCRTYAKKLVGGGAVGGGMKPTKGAMPTFEKKKLPVETDAKRLVEYVCGSNIYKEGEDIKLKPDSEYPDWLWTLHIDKPLPLNQLDPNTLYYWKRVHTINKRRRLAYLKTKKVK